MLIIAGTLYFVQQENQREAIEAQTSKTNELIQEVKTLTLEVRDLGKDNKRLSEQNRNYSYCNAVLFAKYTQTLEPIVIEDLDKCLFTSFPAEEGESSGTFFTPQTTQPSNSVQPSTGNPQTPRNPNGSPNTPNDPRNPNNLLTIPNILELNNPCLKLLQIKTCQ